MSSKNSSAKRTPRAMPMETIITRYKSAQQKKIQEPKKKKEIKSNKKNKTTKKAVQPQSENKITIQEIKQIIQNHEFYPNRHKRNIKRKKIVLIPKHCLKMIGGTKSRNKRKSHTPRKEISYLKYPPNDSITKMIETNSNISFPELIRAIEESGSLNDEDFLEILTCPSPVWWEDPPHGYIEEALYSRSDKEADKAESKSAEITENNYNIANDIVINVDERSKNFIKKRGKLESVLKKMQDKVNNTKSDTFDANEDDRSDNRNSCSMDDDQVLEIRDDEILTNLENINIPIEKDGDKTEYDSDKNMSIDEEYLDMSYFEDDYTNVPETKSNETHRYFKDVQIHTSDVKDKEEYVAVYKIIESDDDIEINDGLVHNKPINDEIVQNMPIKDGIVHNKPINDGIVQNKPINDGIVQNKPINDGIVQNKPINDGIVQNKPIKDRIVRNKPINDGIVQNKQINDGIVQNKPINDGIVQNKPIKDGIVQNKPIGDGIVQNNLINDYYTQKKFKIVGGCDCFKNKSITLSDSVKYCMNCSSINDTDDCKYCLGKPVGRCVCSKYTCDICNVKMTSKNKIIKHLKNHT